MTYTTFKHNCQAWICDESHVPLHRCVGLVDLRVEWKEIDNCSFSGNILKSSADYDYLSQTADRFLLFIRRDKMQYFCIEDMERSWARNVDTGTVEEAVKISGRGGNAFFLWTCDLQPDQTDATATGITYSADPPHWDDCIKYLIRYACVVGTAYDDPDATARGIAGLSVTADVGAHAEGESPFARQGNCWQVIYGICQSKEIDLTFTPAWNGPDGAVTFGIATHATGRGTDKTVDSADPVVISDSYGVMSKADWYRKLKAYATHAYNSLGHVVVAQEDIDGYIRRETRVDHGIEADVALTLDQYDQDTGHTFTFIENRAYQLGTDTQQLWIGDTVTHYHQALETDAKDDLVTGIRLSYANDDVGNETIELILGREKPTENQQRGGRYRPTIEGPNNYFYWALRDDDDDRALPDADNTIGIKGTGGITVQAGANDLTVDGSGLVAAHPLLDGDVHTDTVSATPPGVGSLIVGVTSGETTAWDELVISVNGAMMVSNGIMAVWQGDVTRGDLWVGIEGPTWGNLAIGVANTVLFSNNVDVSWSTLLGIPALTDPGADRGIFWDDSEGHADWLGFGTGFTITDTTVSVDPAGACYWDRDVGGTPYLYPSAAGDDVIIRSSAPANTIKLDAADGQSHFAGAMYIGSAATGASQQLHLYDEGGEVWARWEGGITAELGVNATPIAVWRTLSNNSLSIQPNQSESMHINTVGIYIPNQRKLVMDDGALGTGTYSFYVDPTASPAVCFWAAGMSMNWEGQTYRMPQDAPAAGEALVVNAVGPPAVLEWAAPAAAAHNLLDGSVHGDTVATTVAVGDLMFGTAGGWDELTIGAAGAVLRVGSFFAWPTWDAPSSNPGVASKVLISDASGNLRLQNLTVDTGAYPDTDTGADLGSVSLRFSSIWGNTIYATSKVSTNTIDNYSGAQVQVTANLDVQGDITVTGTVDGVNVAGHTHTVTGDTGAGEPDIAGKATLYSCTDNYMYFKVASDASGTNEKWSTAFSQVSFHTHPVSIETTDPNNP